MRSRAECQRLESRIGDYLAGSLGSEDMAEVEQHIHRCAACRRLFSIASGDLDLLPSESEQLLAGEILRKTSGSACRRAEEEICAFVDGALTPGAARILSDHLQNCAACSSLERTLAELKTELPQMAQAWPGTGFSDDVMAATSRLTGADGMGRISVRERWVSLVHRPRLAWEAAYVVTLLLIVLVGNPALMSMDAIGGKAHSAWTAAAGRAERVSSAGIGGAELAAGRLAEHFARSRTAVQGSLGSCWSRSRNMVAALASVEGSLGARLAAGARSSLQDFARILGIDRTFARALRYLGWTR